MSLGEAADDSPSVLFADDICGAGILGAGLFFLPLCSSLIKSTISLTGVFTDLVGVPL